jgi:hypothetical protein
MSLYRLIKHPALFEFILSGVPHTFGWRCDYMIDKPLAHPMGAVILNHFLDRYRLSLLRHTRGIGLMKSKIGEVGDLALYAG